MAAPREELQEALCQYTTDTLICIDTLRGFCEKIPKWMLGRKTELNMIMDIKDRADKIDLSISQVKQSKKRGKAFLEYMKSKATQMTADSRRKELERELAAVLKDTLGGLEKLNCFLDAVERLAVTSLHVFNEENRVLHLPQEISPGTVQVGIIAARLVCPLLLQFKRDAKAFFLPKLQNVEVLAYQLDKYIQTTQKICDKLEKSCFSEFSLEMATNTVVDLEVNMSEDDIRRMLCHINQLEEIRMDESFRMVFLFKEESCRHFISEFDERQPRMLQFLNDLEEIAVKLDRMNKGAKISSVAGSSVGAVGGVLAIIGLALIPVTAGVSVALTMTGMGLGITSGVNSAVTTATETGVNRTYQKKASEAFKSFMEDVQSLQDCLDEVTNREASQIDVAVGVSKVLCKVGLVGKSIDSFVDAASAVKMLKSEELIVGAGKVVAQEGKALRNVPRVASDIPDIGQAAVKGPLALSNSARASVMAFNALFVGIDIFFICKDSISLAKGSKTEVSQLIRARAALWSSEMDSWKKIHDSLCQGLLTSEKKRAILKTPFEPEMEIKKVKERNGISI
ncbi:apolipoprotein L4-like [Thunnus maccoyii]|uniref:apolipoprotein L4-like n=1 Tax=Thunnus maccoyii TaxID=8240 RepID=UPI001C4B70E9|nr:apolipoprotein L4-like [Thunnus maccoyii]XP_042249721.1 apolipoprotein L4-like [Thunnus maccoyii]